MVGVLVLSLESGGQATSDLTLRLDRRFDHVIKSPKGTSILVTFWSKIYGGKDDSYYSVLIQIHSHGRYNIV